MSDQNERTASATFPHDAIARMRQLQELGTQAQQSADVRSTEPAALPSREAIAPA